MADETIMVVDDTPSNLKLIATILEENAYRVVSFTRGEAALSAARREPPDLVLLDINMPDHDGFSVCRQLKEDSELADIPVLFVSAIGGVKEITKGFSLGAVDYVTKPIHAEEILARVRTHIELRRRELELKQAYRSVLELEKSRDTLVHMVVHDLRAPLSGLLALFNALKMDKDLHNIDEYAEEGIRSTQRLLGLVRRILDLNRIESEAITPVYEEVDLHSLISEVVTEIDPLLQDRDVSVEITGEARIIQSDKELLSRILWNIIDNAIAHTNAAEGLIQIAVTREDNVVSFCVRDNGHPVPADVKEKIFDKYVHTAGDGAGTVGLGLAFCRLAVHTLGGEIGVSDNEWGGSTFSFTLSLTEDSLVVAT